VMAAASIVWPSRATGRPRPAGSRSGCSGTGRRAEPRATVARRPELVRAMPGEAPGRLLPRQALRRIGGEERRDRGDRHGVPYRLRGRTRGGTLLGDQHAGDLRRRPAGVQSHGWNLKPGGSCGTSGRWVRERARRDGRRRLGWGRALRGHPSWPTRSPGKVVHVLIERWMTRRVHVVKPRDSIRHAREIMKRTGSISSRSWWTTQVVGIITDRDLRDAYPSCSTPSTSAAAAPRSPSPTRATSPSRPS